MAGDLLTRLNAIAALLQFDHRIGEANQQWLRARIHHHDWMDFDLLLVSEMLPLCLRRWILEAPNDGTGHSDG